MVGDYIWPNHESYETVKARAKNDPCFLASLLPCFRPAADKITQGGPSSIPTVRNNFLKAAALRL